MDELLSQFLIEARELIAQASDDLAELHRDPGDRGRIDGLFRAVHTLKGSVAIFDMAPAGRALHAAEDMLDRARGGERRLEPADLNGLVSLLDHVDRWVDAMERDGALSPGTEAESAALVAGMGATAESPTAAEPAASPQWLEDLLAAQAEALEGATGELVGFRYRPDSECFFRGDDPLAIAAAIPDLVALAILPISPWPALDAFEPFQCVVRLEGLSAAPIDSVRTAFRLVPDQVETAIVPARRREADRPGEQSGRSLRVDSARIDALADGVGELIVANNALSHVADQAERVDPRIAALIREAHATLDRAVADMRRAVTAVRMVSLGPTLRRLPRMVRETAGALGRKVRLEITGSTTEVDKGIADEIFEPILHLARNAIDHGIEPPERRTAAGKPEEGHLQLAVRRDGDQVVVTMTDDGAGIDPGHIRDVAVERGLIDRESADSLDDVQAIRLIFAPGFSTSAVLSEVSGRGVGMDAVRAAAERLGGKVEIASVKGEGTTIRLRLPLNAIMTRLLVVRAGGEIYGVPLDRIVETASLPTDQILAVGAGRACVLRDRTIPVLSLAALLGAQELPTSLTRLLVTEAETEPVGIIVDGFGRRIDGLVRPTAGLMAGVPGVAGTTLLGDGGVLLVLDLAELVG